ncbi:hypothetical protein [Streptomyces sp. NPDC002763]|uniref:hypothetical protein n=1 Tax=Streptomyces sp. NPDC002763 TaxID=3154427 RepID=UPI0033207A97
MLDTYDTERRSHVRAVIERSVRLGDIVMPTSTTRARLRDLFMRTALRTAWGSRCFRKTRYRPDAPVRSGAVVPSLCGRTDPLVGTAVPRPYVLRIATHRIVRLDDVLGPGWTLLGIDAWENDWATVADVGLPTDRRVDVAVDDRSPRERPERIGTADIGGRADAVFARVTGRFVLVRPDRLVAAVFDAADAERVALHLERHAPRTHSNPTAIPKTSAAAPSLAAVPPPSSGESS